VIDENGVGTSWTSLASAKVSDDAWASASLATAGETTTKLWAENFGFSVPSFATIAGVTVRIERSATGASVMDDSVNLFNGGPVVTSTNHASTAVWPSTDTVETYGGPTDLWGTTLDPSRVAGSSFGPLVSAHGSGSATVRIDAIEVTVHFDVAACPE
jgi:hypothetical protein